MLRNMLKSKIHRATITAIQLEHEGSIACDTSILHAADILPGEKVLVSNLNNGKRLETYAIKGKNGEVALRGAAARLGYVGDRIIIMSFGMVDNQEAAKHKPVIVHLDKHNRIIPKRK